MAAAFLPQQAFACAACMGDPNSKIAGASNGVMFFLLAILGGVFSLMGAFAFFMIRQAKAPTPPHVELGDAIEPQPHGL